MATWLYRIFDRRGVLLYVGITAEPQRRLATHRRRSWFANAESCTWRSYPDRRSAVKDERYAIWFERPLHNDCAVARSRETFLAA